MVLRFFLLAITFLFASCSDLGERDNPNDLRSINYRAGGVTYSSLSVKPSSSSAQVSSSSKPSSSSAPPSSSSVAPSSSSAQVVAVSCDMNYRTTTIGSQVWMAENLNCNVSGSKCYNNIEVHCNKYGRLYDWATAMNLPSSCNDNSCSSQIGTKHQGICPDGWHIPSNADWNELIATAGGDLKATSGWSNGNGEDTYGFSALPGGCGRSYGSSFVNGGIEGNWWSSSESNAYAIGGGMLYSFEFVYYSSNKHYLFSVRCLQD